MNIKDVESLAGLARIELSPEEKDSLLSDMESILGYVKQIEEVKIDKENFASDTETHNIWREDLSAVAGANEAPNFSKELITDQFSDKQDNFLKVKKIL